MVGTKHCCWGECKTDSRYPERWPKSLKELNESGEKVFMMVNKIDRPNTTPAVRAICKFAVYFSVF